MALTHKCAPFPCVIGGAFEISEVQEEREVSFKEFIALAGIYSHFFP
jgi:hypothetical protein